MAYIESMFYLVFSKPELPRLLPATYSTYVRQDDFEADGLSILDAEHVYRVDTLQANVYAPLVNTASYITLHDSLYEVAIKECARKEARVMAASTLFDVVNGRCTAPHQHSKVLCACTVDKEFHFSQCGILRPHGILNQVHTWLPVFQYKGDFYAHDHVRSGPVLIAHSAYTYALYEQMMNYVDAMYPSFFKHTEPSHNLQVVHNLQGGTLRRTTRRKKAPRPQQRKPYSKRDSKYSKKSFYILERNKYVSSRRHARKCKQTPRTIDDGMQGEMPKQRYNAPARKLPRVKMGGPELIKGYDAYALERTLVDRAHGKTKLPLPPEVFREANTMIPLHMDKSQQTYEAYWEENFGEQLAVVRKSSIFNYVMAKRRAQDIINSPGERPAERDDHAHEFIEGWFNEQNIATVGELVRVGFTKDSARAPHVLRAIFELLTRFRVDPVVFDVADNGIKPIFGYADALVKHVRHALRNGIRRLMVPRAVMAAQKVEVKRAIMQSREVQEQLSEFDAMRANVASIKDKTEAAVAKKELDASKQRFFKEVVGPKVADKTQHTVFKQETLRRSAMSKQRVRHAKAQAQRERFNKHAYMHNDDMEGEMNDEIRAAFEDPASQMKGEMLDFLCENLPYIAGGAVAVGATAAFVTKFTGWLKDRVETFIESQWTRVTNCVEDGVTRVHHFIVRAREILTKLFAVVGLLAIWYLFGPWAAVAAIAALNLAQQLLGDGRDNLWFTAISGWFNQDWLAAVTLTARSRMTDVDGRYEEFATIVEELRRHRTADGEILITFGDVELNVSGKRYVCPVTCLNGFRLPIGCWPLIVRLNLCVINLILLKDFETVIARHAADGDFAAHYATAHPLHQRDEGYDHLAVRCQELRLSIAELDTVQLRTDEIHRRREILRTRLGETQRALKACIKKHMFSMRCKRQPVTGTLESALTMPREWVAVNDTYVNAAVYDDMPPLEIELDQDFEHVPEPMSERLQRVLEREGAVEESQDTFEDANSASGETTGPFDLEGETLELTYESIVRSFVESMSSIFSASKENSDMALRIARMFTLGLVTKTMCSAVAYAFKAVYGAFVYVLTGTHPFEDELTTDTEVAETIVADMAVVRAPTTDEEATRTIALYDEALTFMSCAMKTRAASGYARVFQAMVPHYEASRQRLSNPKARAPPVTVMFVGKGGSGKSTSMEIIMDLICQSIHGRSIQGRDRYNQSSDAFFSGYFNGLFYVFDEFGSTVDTTDSVAFNNKMFLAINSAAACNLPMAEAHHKGTTYFTSPYCFYATNMSSETASSLGFKDASAFARRISYAVEAIDTSDEDPRNWTYNIVGGSYANKENFQHLGVETFDAGRTHSLGHVLCNANLLTPVSLTQLVAILVHSRVPAKAVEEKMVAKPDLLKQLQMDISALRKFDSSFKYSTQVTVVDNVPHGQRQFGFKPQGPGARPQRPPADDSNPILRAAAAAARDGAADMEGESPKARDEQAVNAIRLRRKRTTSTRERAGKLLSVVGRVLLFVSPLLASALYYFTNRAEQEGEVGSRGIPKSAGARQRAPRTGKVPQTTVMLAESTVSNANFPDMRARIKAAVKTQCLVSITGADGASTEVRGVYVTPHHVMVVGHAVPVEVCGVRVCEIGQKPEDCEFFQPHEIVRVAAHDLVYFKVGHMVNGVLRDRSPHVCLKTFVLPHATITQSAVQGARLAHVCFDVLTNMSEITQVIGKNLDKVRYTTEAFGSQEYDSMLSYEMCSKAGHCGSLVFMEVNGCAHVIGFHTAGNKRDTGSGHLITREFIEQLFTMSGEAAPAPPVFPVDDANPVKQVTFSDIEDTHHGLRVIGIVDPQYRVKVGGTTKYHDSPLQGLFAPPKYAPAVLEPTERGDPYAIGMKKFPTCVAGRGVVPFRKEVMELFKFHYPPDGERQLYTMRQAVAGDASIGLKGLDVSTSTGAPWTEGGVSDKSRYVHIERDGEKVTSVGLDAELHRAVVARIAAAEEGQRTLTVFCQRLKDELRSLEKVEACKTRLFDNGPVDYLIALRMYMLDMTQYCKIHCDSKPISLGVNAHGPEWGYLLSYLTHYNQFGADGDFANFDASIMPEIGYLAIDIINDWYGGVGKVARTTLLWELLNTYHVAGNKLFMTYGSHPSGDPITTLWNSICNFIILASSFFQIRARDEVPRFDPFKMRMALYGDDNIIVVAEPDFPYEQMTELVHDLYGMTLTASDKSGPMKKSLVKDMSYLSRRFVFRDGLWHAPLELDIVYSILDWAKSRDTRDFQSRINSFFYELTHHPHHLYETHYLKVLRHPWVRECAFDVPTLAQSLHRRLHW